MSTLAIAIGVFLVGSGVRTALSTAPPWTVRVYGRGAVVGLALIVAGYLGAGAVMWNLLWLVPLCIVIGLVAANWPKGEPTYTADSWEDVPPVGGE